jgi:hypothetical protein
MPWNAAPWTSGSTHALHRGTACPPSGNGRNVSAESGRGRVAGLRPDRPDSRARTPIATVAGLRHWSITAASSRGADRVPHPDEADSWLVAVEAPEQPRLGVRGCMPRADGMAESDGLNAGRRWAPVTGHRHGDDTRRSTPVTSGDPADRRGGDGVVTGTGDRWFSAGQAVTVDDDQSIVLLVRVWLEHGADGFRARLTTAGPWWGNTGTDVTVALASTPDAVTDAVRAWLLSLASAQP